MCEPPRIELNRASGTTSAAPSERSCGWEYHRFTTGKSWFDAKYEIIRDAVRAYLAHPRYRLPKMATA